MVRRVSTRIGAVFAATLAVSRPDAGWASGALPTGGGGKAIAAQNDALFLELKEVHRLPEDQLDKIKGIFTRSGFMGQGNPAATQHPMTREQCQERVKKAGATYENAEFEKICGSKFMAPLYNPQKQRPADAKSCIDQFEFPNVPCDYPVTWTRAREAQEVCSAMGKRLCDAHEWEGGCAGALEDPDYPFELATGQTPNAAFNRMRAAHNQKHAATKSWAYGPAFKKGVCAQDSQKSANCDPSGNVWGTCGTNTYPAGSFPECRSQLAVFDIHGNAAEHMNLPTNESEMTSRGSTTLGLTEMKGSWFIWDKYQAHQDWCRWRAPYWHGSRVMDKESHHNYHLGFRCCKTVGN